MDVRLIVSLVPFFLCRINPNSIRTTSTGHSYELTTFPRAESCDHCNFLLWGMLYQGVRCRNCKIRLHHDCINLHKDRLVEGDEKCVICVPSTATN